MYIVLGSTGHVGSAVVNALLASGCAVTAVTRDETKARKWREKGAQAAVVNIKQPEELRALLRRGTRAFLLNPPAQPSSDTDQVERQTAHAIVTALNGTGLEKVVVQSTYGAQPGNAIGDLSVLLDFEEAVRSQPVPTGVLRAAYYMSNWDMMIEAARNGVLPTMFPADLAIPMVAPADVGQAAAHMLSGPTDQGGTQYVEGPERYSARDVADAFSRALGVPVEPAVMPREDWEAAYRKLGFSAPAASAYARMTAVTVDGHYVAPDRPRRGQTTLAAYVAALVDRHQS